MATGCVRPMRRAKAVVCAVIGISLAATVARPTSDAAAKTPPVKAPITKPAAERAARPARTNKPLPTEPAYLNDDKGKPQALVYPPKREREAQPVTVMLHGMCDEPEYECPHFAGSTTPRGWLVCPRANLRCDGGGSIWSFDARFPKTVEASIERVKSEHPEAVESERGRTLIGFSLGALRAVDLAHAGDGKYRYVVLIGAKVYPDAERLRKAGVERIVLAAGDHDMMKWHMVEQARKLARRGFPTAFVSLGKIGHAFPADLGARMTRALDWLEGNDAAFVPSERGELAFTRSDAVASRRQ